MSGMWIASGLVLVYLAHTYFFWKSGSRFEQRQEEEKHDEQEHRDAYWGTPRLTAARSHHFVHR